MLLNEILTILYLHEVAGYVRAIKARCPGVDNSLINDLFKKEWLVFAERPFGNPKSVIEYRGRYTHKIAISNHRIKNMDQKTVSFSYKDYRNGARKSLMTLDAMEFIRRFPCTFCPKDLSVSAISEY